MPMPGSADLRGAIQRAFIQEAGTGGDARVLTAAALRFYGMLTQQLTPLIGDVGVTALIARSVYLTQQEFPWLADDARDPDRSDGPLSHVRVCLERQEPAVVGPAVAALFATFGGLLASMIGGPLTTRLLRQAWPGFSDETAQETDR